MRVRSIGRSVYLTLPYVTSPFKLGLASHPGRRSGGRRPIQLQQLRFLTALARERHFGRAAAACQITQPTLSAGIKDLERELGVELVERNVRFVGLTATGERVLGWAERIVAQCDTLHEDVGTSRTDVAGSLTLAAVPSAAPAAALLVDALAVRHKNVTATVLSCSATEIARGVDDGEFDAGVSYLDAPWVTARGVGIPLYDEQYVLVTPSGSPIADRRTATWREAAAERLCLLDSRMQYRQLINAAFSMAGVVPAARIEADSVMSVLSHVRFGGYAAILPHVFLPLIGQWDETRFARLIDPVVTHPVGLIIPSRRPLPPTTAALADVAATLDVDGWC